jgi:hypothetical protein
MGLNRRRLLRQAVARAAMRPFFLAADLKSVPESRGIGLGELAEWLGCSEDTLLHAALSRSPTRGPEFRSETEAIAQRFGLRAERLAAVLREQDAVTGLRAAQAAPLGWMAAARDRDHDERGNDEGRDQ